MLVRALLVMDHPQLGTRLTRLLQLPDVLLTAMTVTAIELPDIERESPDLILLPRALLPGSGLSLMRALRHLPEEPEVIVLCDHEDAHERANLLAAGACAVACTSVPDGALGALLARQIERRARALRQRLEAGNAARSVRLADFASTSPAMHAFLSTVYQVVDADASLLILGETGVGKEHLARAIHAESPRREGPFVAVNCGALPEHLLESELFGHEAGAFTGATRAVRGQFELAHHGTIFLDEIGEMPIHLQVKLLQVLERRQIRRVGGERLVDIDVRILAATNRNLPTEVENRRFRQDLYYRLGAITLIIPPLRERREDIPELAQSYLRHFRLTTGRNVVSLSPAAAAALARYEWPGNVRELINVMERAVLLSKGSVIDPTDLPAALADDSMLLPPPGVQAAVGAGPAWPMSTDLPLPEARKLATAAFDRCYLTALLQQTHGNIAETARRAGISTRALNTHMRQLGLDKKAFRTQQ